MGLLAWILHLRAGPCWIVRCRDEDGHRVRLQIWASASGVLLSVSGQDVVVLPGLAVGRLRGALREAAVSAGLASVEKPSRSMEPLEVSGGSRRRVSLRTPSGSLGVPA